LLRAVTSFHLFAEFDFMSLLGLSEHLKNAAHSKQQSCAFSHRTQVIFFFR